MKSNLQLAKDLLAALASGASDEVVAAYFAPEATAECLASPLRATSEHATAADVVAALLLEQRRFDGRQTTLRGVLASGDAVVLEVDWRAVVRGAQGVFAADSAVVGRTAWFFEFRGGRVVRLRCYESAEPTAP